MIQDWLKVDGAAANKAAFEQKYKELDKKMAQFQKNKVSKAPVMTPVDQTKTKWAGKWAAEAWEAAARARPEQDQQY